MCSLRCPFCCFRWLSLKRTFSSSAAQNTFVGDEKYVEVRAEVEAVAAQYEGASIEESVTERVNSKGVATSMVTFTVKEKIKRNGLDFLLGGIGHSEGMTGIGPTNIMRLLLVCLAVSAGAGGWAQAIRRWRWRANSCPKRQSGCIWLPAYLR